MPAGAAVPGQQLVPVGAQADELCRWCVQLKCDEVSQHSLIRVIRLFGGERGYRGPMTRDYLPPGGPDPEDFFRTLAAEARPAPNPSDLGSVFVSAVSKSEDYWCAAWQRGEDHRDVIGPLETVMAWARAQRASHYLTIDEATGQWVPLTMSHTGHEETGASHPTESVDPG